MNPFPPQITDIHTHNPACHDTAVLNIAAGEPLPDSPRYLSTGLHPWQTVRADRDRLTELAEAAAADPRVLAIGECGLDALRGAPLEIQEEIFRRHALAGERLGKPLIIHCVKAFDRLLRIHKELRPSQPWIIHGFRGKAATARQLTGAGLGLSLGEHFNAESAAVIPSGMLFTETDESLLPIEEIRERIASARKGDFYGKL